MKLFGFQEYIPHTEMRQDCLCLFIKSENGNGVSVFLPWMVHGKYYPPCSNLMHFGWRCAKLNIILGMKFAGKVTDRVKFIPHMVSI